VSLAFIAAAAASALPAPTLDQAVERQRDQVLDAISPCRRAASREEIVVCGERHIDSQDLARTPSGAAPPQAWAAPASGPWFTYRRGPLTLTCCSVNGSRGTGAGLGLQVGF
jgi:hypothetical protein